MMKFAALALAFTGTFILEGCKDSAPDAVHFSIFFKPSNFEKDTSIF
jgi:hypothetical protein